MLSTLLELKSTASQCASSSSRLLPPRAWQSGGSWKITIDGPGPPCCPCFLHVEQQANQLFFALVRFLVVCSSLGRSARRPTIADKAHGCLRAYASGRFLFGVARIVVVAKDSSRLCVLLPGVSRLALARRHFRHFRGPRWAASSEGTSKLVFRPWCAYIGLRRERSVATRVDPFPLLRFSRAAAARNWAAHSDPSQRTLSLAPILVEIGG